jgi:hypothetical protein
MLPGVVPVEAVIGRSERAAVCVSRLAAYPTGLIFDVVALTADLEAHDGPFGMFMRARRGSGSEFPPELLRFGVLFADGRRATNVEGNRFEEPSEGSLHLVEHGGAGGGGRWEQQFWLSPLPPHGPLTFVCAWPAYSIAESRFELDSQPVRAAADRAQLVLELPYDEDDEDDGPRPRTIIR